MVLQHVPNLACNNAYINIYHFNKKGPEGPLMLPIPIENLKIKLLRRLLVQHGLL